MEQPEEALVHIDSLEPAPGGAPGGRSTGDCRPPLAQAPPQVRGPTSSA